MDTDWEIGTFKQEVKRFGHIVKKLRNRKTVTIYDRSCNTFYRFVLDRREKRIFWKRDASKDQRNWVNQIKYLRLDGVLQLIYENKVRNKLND
jgi:hypothetical protein